MFEVGPISVVSRVASLIIRVVYYTAHSWYLLEFHTSIVVYSILNPSPVVQLSSE